MRQTNRLVLISLLVVLGLSGCVSSKPIHYYTTQVPTAPGISATKYPVVLLVSGISGPQILKDTPIVYRIGANEIGTYQYSRWVEPPVVRLEGNLIRLLRSSGNYQSVTSLASGSDGQFVVRGRLYDFEEVDGPNITGLVTMEFELYDRRSGKVVWSHSYSQSGNLASR